MEYVSALLGLSKPVVHKKRRRDDNDNEELIYKNIALTSCKDAYMYFKHVRRVDLTLPFTLKMTTIEELGSGAFGEVRLVQYGALRCKAAVKKINKKTSFQTEHQHLMDAYNRIDDIDGIMKIYFVDVDKQEIVMEYIEGELCEDNQNIKNYMTCENVNGLVRTVLQMHQRGVYHRDIKPSNIMFNTTTKKFVIIDLGFITKNKYKSGIGYGTQDYYPPEFFSSNLFIIDGEDAHNDVLSKVYTFDVERKNETFDNWALGVTLLEILTSFDNVIETLCVERFTPRDVSTYNDIKNAPNCTKNPEQSFFEKDVEEAIKLVPPKLNWIKPIIADLLKYEIFDRVLHTINCERI